jgi:hypothetical protein
MIFSFINDRFGSKAPVADCQNAVEATHGLPAATDILFLSEMSYD